MKKRGFGEGRWNGFGGKVEMGESVAEGAARELMEESCLKANVEHLDEIGEMNFKFIGDPVELEVHVFQVFQWEGFEKETEEMRPQWWDENKVPFSQMWPDDELWFPHLLRFHFTISD